MFNNYLKDNNLIIVPNYLKKKVINEINNLDKLINYKIISLDEFREEYFFKYDKRALYYIIKKYDTTYEIALEYINSLYFIEDKEYKNNKLNKLVELKKELLENNLLIKNNNFLYYLENTNIIIYGYYLDQFYLNIFNKYNYNIINIEANKKEIEVLEFSSITDEISYICSDIKNKLDNNIDINTIKIINSGKEYINPIERIFNISNIPINIPNKTSLYDLDIGKKIINLLKENNDFSTILSNISEESTYYNSIISIFNNYNDFDYDNSVLVRMIEYDLKHAYLPLKHLNNAISFINIEEANNLDINYLIGFNKENYPTIYKDEEFLSDSMKKELNLLTSNDKNILEQEKLINLLNSNNYIITYKLKDSFDPYNPSILLNNDNFKIIKDTKINYNFSNLYNKVKLVSEYDNFYKYGIISDNLKLLKENYNLSYNSYDNSFTGINNDTFLNSIDKLKLSYSSLDNYFRCSFRYYISNILNIEDDSDEFYRNIGNIFHYVLSKYRNIDFNLDNLWNEGASKYNFSLSESVLLNKLKDELRYDIEIIKKQENYSTMHDYYFENKFSLIIPNLKNKEVRFSGIIDKIIYSKEDNNTLVSIIDYKTGNLPSDLSNVIYGIGMQLPIYLYLIKRSNLFPNSIIVGFYLQKIINKDIKATVNKTKEELKEKELRLVGYSNTDYIDKFDTTYKDSSYIASLKTKNDGSFYAYSKVIDNKEIEELDKIVSDNINKATNDILNANFTINPKRINNEDIGCMYCPYRDICFKKEKDFIDLPKHNGLDFLGGDNNA